MNLLGVWRTVRACLPHVIERRGYVLVIASAAAASHSPGMAAYAASKAGAEAFANSLRAELAHLGVNVGVGYFAFLDTDLVRGADTHPVFGKLRFELPGPLGKTYPLPDAVGKVVDGIERRARTVVFPGWVRAMLWSCAVCWGPCSTADRAPGPPRWTPPSRATWRSAAPRTPPSSMGAGGEAARRRETSAL